MYKFVFLKLAYFTCVKHFLFFFAYILPIGCHTGKIHTYVLRVTVHFAYDFAGQLLCRQLAILIPYRYKLELDV